MHANQLKRHAGLLMLTTALALSTCGAAEEPAGQAAAPTVEQLKQAQARIAVVDRSLRSLQHNEACFANAVKMLSELPLRPAPITTLVYVENSLKAAARDVALATREIEALKALQAGDMKTHNGIMAEVESARDAPIPGTSVSLAQIAPLLIELEKRSMVEHDRQLVRRRGMEDHLSIIQRAAYHIRNLKGGFIPNEQFEQQFASLYAGQIMFDATGRQDPAAALDAVAKQIRPLLSGAARRLQGAKDTFLPYLQHGEEAKAELRQAAVFIVQAREQLDKAEKIMTPTLLQLGMDVSTEKRRPITFDDSGNPSDVIVSIDNRAEKYLDILEADSLWTGIRENKLLVHNDTGMQILSESFKALREAKGDTEDELFAKSAAGQLDKHRINFWHPEVRETVRQRFKALGEKHAGKTDIMYYPWLTAEPVGTIHPKQRDSAFFGFAAENARSDAAIAAFREWLKEKFLIIADLNAAWDSTYAGFDTIDPPPDPYQVRRRRATPLTYEHEMFRRETVADVIGIAAGAIMEGDPDHPVSYEMPGMMNYALETPFSNHDLLTRVPAKMVEMHKNDFWPSIPVLIYNATVTPSYGKVPVQTEFVWNWGRRSTPAGEEETYRQGLQNIWRNTTYGIRVLHPFAHFNWIGYENGYMDIMANKRFGRSSNMGGFVLRDSATAIPIGSRRARRFGKLLRETRLAPREVAVLQPSTATINCYPYFHINWSFSPYVQEAKNFHDLLFDRNYQYGYVLEESLFDGKADLADYPVVIVPYAVYLADGMNTKLLDYVWKGGTVIASGIPGLYDKYGRDDGTFVKEVFGDVSTRYDGSDYIWLFEIDPVGLKDSAHIVVESNGNAMLLSATYGKGRV